VAGMHAEPYRRASSTRILAGRIRIIAAAAMLCGIGAMLLGLWVVSFAESNAAVLLPPDLTLTPPSADVPPDIAAFAGMWAGDRWDGKVPHALAVERVGADGTASLVYALGADKSASHIHGFERLTGKIAGGRLTVTAGGNAVVYSLTPDGRLAGRSTTPNSRRSHILLRRVTGPDLAAKAKELPPRLWQEIEIPAGDTLSLRTTLYRTDLKGRRKLIIIAHGSPDADIASEGETLRYEDQARIFLALGYTVAIPMRKGRGGSGGGLLEGTFESGPPEPQIAAGLEDLDAALRYFATQPYVDPNDIVIVGIERGGLLAVLYAARHPGAVAAVVNVSGEWWPASYRGGAINTAAFTEAGRTIKCPTLWLYALSRSGAARGHMLENLRAFQEAGGAARLAVVPEPDDIVAYGTHLFDWPARWEDLVARFLKGLAPASG
jgi:dienelactone hydrolase